MLKLFSAIMIVGLLFLGGYFGNLGQAAPLTAKPGDNLNAIANGMNSGDVLLLQDGTYTTTAPDFISLTGKSGITIRAMNERKAWLKGTGAGNIIYLNNCSNITIDGLRMSSADLNTNLNARFLYLYKCSGCTIRRNILYYNNRYRNEAPIGLELANGNLIEENELYWFHRNGINLSSSSSNIVRRNYGNSRNYADISGGASTAPEDSSRGDHFITIYPGSGNIIENNISEGNTACLSIEASGYNGISANNNRVDGNISIADDYGFLHNNRVANSAIGTPTNNSYENNVSINSRNIGFYIRTSSNTTGTNNTSIGSRLSGFAWDKEATGGVPSPSFTFINTLALNNKNYGTYIDQQMSWALDFVNCYNNSPGNFSPGTDANRTHSLSVNPNLGSAMIWIPAGTTMKGAGKNGADIGANIIYRYQNGSLTNQPLWNADGSFPHGAIVPGVNDLSGSSAVNVNQRIGSIPVLSNAPATTPTITTPTNLIVVTTTPIQPLPPVQQQPPVETITPGTPAGTTSPVSKTVIIGAAAALLLVLASD